MSEMGMDGRSSGLFRPAALERAGGADALDLGVHVIRAPQWLLLLVAFGLAVGAVAISLVLSVPSRVDASGILITAEGLKDIETLSAGRVKDIFVAPGDLVRQGQKIMQIDQPDLLQQLEQAQSELANLNGRYQRIVGFLDTSKADTGALLQQKRQELESLIEVNKSQIEWLKKNLAGYERLAVKGFLSQQKLFEAQVNLNDAMAQQIRNINALAALKFDENAQKIARDREILDLEVKIEEARANIAAIREKRDRMAYLESPYDGVVIEQKVDLGELIETGKPVLSVLPGYLPSTPEAPGHIPLVATLYLPSTEGKRVQPGMHVEISPSTAKREEYGFIHGRITWRSAIPATPEGMMRSLKNRQLVESLSAAGAPFEATATLDPDPSTVSGFRWSSSAGPNQTISPGNLASARIIVKEQPLISLVMPALRGVIGDLGH